jgi:hypothetical protein
MNAVVWIGGWLADGCCCWLIADFICGQMFEMAVTTQSCRFGSSLVLVCTQKSSSMLESWPVNE